MTIVRTRGNTAKVGISGQDRHLENVIAGTNVSIDYSDPLNPVISSTGGGSSYTAGNGLTLSGSDFKLGGTLTENTTIDLDGYSFSLTDASVFNLNATGNAGNFINLTAQEVGSNIYSQCTVNPNSNQSGFNYFNSSVSNDETYEANLFASYNGVDNKWSGNIGATGAYVWGRYGWGLDTETLVHGFHIYANGTNYGSSPADSDLKFRIRSTGEVTLNLGSDATNDMYYRNSSGYLTRLAAGTNGYVLTSNSGVPTWAAPSGGGGGITIGSTSITGGTSGRLLTSGTTVGELTLGTGVSTWLTTPSWTNFSSAITGTAPFWSLASGGTLTGANTITGTTTNILKGVFDNLNVTQTNGAGLWLANTQSAGAGAQQISPSLVLEGQGWKTNSTAASQSVKFSMDVLPVQGAANPTGYFIIRSSINNSAYTAGNGLFLLTNGGDLSLLGGITITGSSSTGRAIIFNGGNGELRADANSTIALRMNAGATAQSSGYFRVYNTAGNYTNTSGENVVQGLEMPFAPTSGTGTLTGLKISGTINQTGGANGNITGVYYNPTITSVTGVHYAIRANSGRVLFGGLPTSSAGLSAGELWNNSGVVNIV